MVQASVLVPAMFIEHEPQMPSRQERRREAPLWRAFIFIREFLGTYARPGSLFLTSPKIVRSAVGEIQMIAEPKRKPHQNDSDRDQNDNDRDKRERRHQEKALDEALKNTFPASDPVSVEQPVPPAADRDRAKT
jgi:hypothetical protein